MNKSENIDIIQQMVEVSEMYRGNKELFFQQGEETIVLAWVVTIFRSR